MFFLQRHESQSFLGSDILYRVAMTHIGCLELLVSFHKRATNYRALLTCFPCDGTKVTRLLDQIFGAGWQRPIGCLELQVFFRKIATNCRALLRKKTHEDETDVLQRCLLRHLHLSENICVSFETFASLLKCCPLIIGLFCDICVSFETFASLLKCCPLIVGLFCRK